MDTGSRIKLVREHRGLTQQKLGEMLGYGKSSANRIAQYEMGYRSPKANRLKEIAKAMNIREEIFLMPDETPIDLLRILIWYDWEHEGVLQLATSRTANTPPGKTVSPIIYSEQLPLNRLLLDWADQKHSLSVRKITRADYLESSTVSAPPSTGPMDFMEEWIRMVSCPVRPISARSCRRSSLV